MRFRSPGLQTTNKTHLTSALLPAYNAFHIQEDEWERPANEWNSMDLFHKRHFIERVGWNHWQWSCPKCKCMNDINELLSHLIFKITHCLRKYRHLSTSMLFFYLFFFSFSVMSDINIKYQWEIGEYNRIHHFEGWKEWKLFHHISATILCN